MGLNDVREALRSDARLVVVEAPAGCGKTFEAIGCAVDLAAELPPHQEVLLLAHTNVAVGEFRRRARKAGAGVHATTIDAFALRLIAPYAAALDLPSPIVPGDGAGEVPFRDLAPKGLELLQRAPSIGRAIAGHYPVVLLDEHQDTRQDQHDLAMGLGARRVRIFGDPMQAIYGFEGEALIDWMAVADDAEMRESLGDPQRWPDVPELGEWILGAREALAAGGGLPLDTAPGCVRVERMRNLGDMPNPNYAGVAPALISVLGELLQRLEGSVVVLTRYNAHVRGLFSAVRGALVVQEGADLSAAHTALAAAEGAVGNPRELAWVAIDLLSATCRGLDAAIRGQLDASLQPAGLERGRRRRIAMLLEALEPLYERPDVGTWCRAIARILRHPPDWLKIDLPASVRVLGRLQMHEDQAPREALEAALRHRHEAAAVPVRCASTIHKAKGQEFDHVIVAHCSAAPFPGDDDSRRLLYVALSRARRSITILASRDSPSPLVA